MKKILCSHFFLCSFLAFSQISNLVSNNLIAEEKLIDPNQKTESIINTHKKDDDFPLLIPQKKHGKYGYVNTNKNIVIPHEYYIAMFFSEDCNLLNSPNSNVRKFGSSDYATVEKNMISYRINSKGQKVYQFKNEDLGKCNNTFEKDTFLAYKLDGKFGVIDRNTFTDPSDNKQFKIYPQYEYLFVLESRDRQNPMIVAVKNDKFGIIDIDGNVVIPFEYSDIKRNYSWKLGKMFEVTKDNQTYYYVDINNKTY